MSADQRLRVMYVVPDLALGGAERHVTTLMPRLDPRRFEPSVVCIGEQGALFSTLRECDVPSVAFGRTKRQAVLSLVDLVRHFWKTSPDIVIVRGFSAETLGRVAALITRVPHVVVWVHNCDDVQERGRLRRVLDKVLERKTDAYFGIALGQVPYLVDACGHPEHKIRIIHNGVDPTLFDHVEDDPRAGLGIGPRDLVVGILAALRPEKDHETFLRAAKIVAAECREARFLIVGGGPRQPNLEDLTEQLGLTDRVVFAGPREDVPALLRAMDVFVLSSFTVECLPMALLEAMASRRSSVCTAVGGIPEMIEDEVSGYLVPPKDPEALAERLVHLLTSPDRREEMGAAARARVETMFTLHRSVVRTQTELLDVANRSSSGARPRRLVLILDETYIGGVELLMLNMFRVFDPLVVQPRVICLRSAGPLAADFRAIGVDVEVMGRSGRFDLRTLPRMIASLRRQPADAVLVTHHHRAALALGRLAARAAGVRVSLVAVHDMDLASIGKRCLPRWAVATLRLGANALVLLSPRQGEYLHRQEGVGARPWSRTNEVVIRNGIEVQPLPSASDQREARARLGVGTQDFVVGIVARLSAQKAHHVLFEAFADLVRSHPHSRLVVVGGGQREPELRELATRLGIANVVLFTGVRRDVPKILPAFDVACLSSVHEGVPITVIEAMSAGLPVVATSCGGLPDLVTDGEQGFIVPVGDSETFAQRLRTLATDPTLRHRQGRSARERVERCYRIEQTARGYERLIVDLIGARP